MFSLSSLVQGGIQVKGLQYVGQLVVRDWFLRWNCFLLVWMRQVVNFTEGGVWRLKMLG